MVGVVQRAWVECCVESGQGQGSTPAWWRARVFAGAGLRRVCL